MASTKIFGCVKMKSVYKYELALVVILPIIIAIIGGSFIYGGFKSFAGLGVPDIVKGMIGPFDFYIGCSLLMGLIALLYRYIKTSLYFLATVLLSLVYAVYLSRNTVYPIGLIKGFTGIFAVSVALTFIVTHVFFNHRLMHFRTALLGILSALALTAFFRYIFFVLKAEIEAGFWINRFVSSLFLFMFIGFGLSMADLIAIKADIKRSKGEEAGTIEIDEDEEVYSISDDDPDSEHKPLRRRR